MTSADELDFEKFVAHVLDDLVPKLEDSVATISIVPQGGQDVKFAVELGISILLDKPIILIIPPDTRVPDHLIRVADDIVELDDVNFENRLGYAIQRQVQLAESRHA